MVNFQVSSFSISEEDWPQKAQPPREDPRLEAAEGPCRLSQAAQSLLQRLARQEESCSLGWEGFLGVFFLDLFGRFFFWQWLLFFKLLSAWVFRHFIFPSSSHSWDDEDYIYLTTRFSKWPTVRAVNHQSVSLQGPSWRFLGLPATFFLEDKDQSLEVFFLCLIFHGTRQKQHRNM